MTNWMQDAIDEVIAQSPALFNDKAGAVEYYQDKFGDAKKGKALLWKKNLIDDLLAVNDIRPDVDKAEFKRQYKNLSKRFDPQRLSNPEKRNAKQYEDLARELKLIQAPEGGYHVTYKGGILFSKCEYREFEVDITDDLADDVASHPDHIIQYAIMVYMQMEGEDTDDIPGPCTEDTGDPTITVEASSEVPIGTGTVKRHKSAVRRFFK